MANSAKKNRGARNSGTMNRRDEDERAQRTQGRGDREGQENGREERGRSGSRSGSGSGGGGKNRKSGDR